MTKLMTSYQINATRLKRNYIILDQIKVDVTSSCWIGSCIWWLSAKPRPRGPKRPIPEELKDDKYFEKRSRNNEAAKKSRSSKKDREVEVQERTKLLEGESSFLDAEIANLEREINGLKRQRKLYA